MQRSLRPTHPVLGGGWVSSHPLCSLEGPFASLGPYSLLLLHAASSSSQPLDTPRGHAFPQQSLSTWYSRAQTQNQTDWFCPSFPTYQLCDLG